MDLNELRINNKKRILPNLNVYYTLKDPCYLLTLSVKCVFINMINLR